MCGAARLRTVFCLLDIVGHKSAPRRVGVSSAWVTTRHSAMSAQCPVCPKADTTGRFMSTRPSQARSPPKVEDTEMCDYSLHGVHSRPAKVNDHLVTTQFRNTITSGFSEIGKSHVAVCLLPGTEICFDQEVERAPTVQFFLFRRSTRIISYKVARFRQVNMNNPCTHHAELCAKVGDGMKG
jgi:hypothetical protein